MCGLMFPPIWRRRGQFGNFRECVSPSKGKPTVCKQYGKLATLRYFSRGRHPLLVTPTPNTGSISCCFSAKLRGCLEGQHREGSFLTQLQNLILKQPNQRYTLWLMEKKNYPPHWPAGEEGQVSANMVPFYWQIQNIHYGDEGRCPIRPGERVGGSGHRGAQHPQRKAILHQYHTEWGKRWE